MEQHNSSKLDTFNAAVTRLRQIVRARMGDRLTAVVDEFLTERRAAAEVENRD